MGVDEAGEDDFAGHIHLGCAAVGPHPHNEALRHGDVPPAQLVGEHIDVDGVFQHQIGLLTAGGHLHDPQFLAQLAVDAAGVALSSHTDHPFSAVALRGGQVIDHTHFITGRGICLRGRWEKSGKGRDP